MLLKEKDFILFQGDSITDAGRDYQNGEDLAGGYVGMTAELLNKKYPQLHLKVLNRGVSGNRSADMLARWKEDCLDLKPDVVSILIGVNDTWRRYDQNLPTSAEEYQSNLRTCLQQTKAMGAKIVMLCPFLLPAEDKAHFREDLDPKIAAFHELAGEYADVVVPLDDIFQALLSSQPNQCFSDDGVHPNAAGAQVIAGEWIKAVEAY